MFRFIDLRKNFYAVRCFFRSIIPSNAMPPTAIIEHAEGSGTDATRTPLGSFSPVMKLALIAAPVAASYSPTAPPNWFPTKRLLPDNASWPGLFIPVMKLGLIAAPVVALYSPTVLPPKFATKRSLPDNARSAGDSAP